MRTKRSIKDSLKEYLNWCVGRLLLGGSRDDTVRDMVDAISNEIASGGGVVSQDQLDQTVKDITKSYGIADQTVLTSAESYTDQKIADVVDGSPEALDTLYELAKALGDDPNFATTLMDLIGQKLPTTTFENFVDNKAWTKDNLTKLSQLVNNINSIKAGTRVESMDINLASISSYLRYDLFDSNTTGTKPPGLTTGFLLTFSWDNGGWGAQIATSDGNVDGAIFLRTIKASESDKIWGPWVSLYNTANFNPDDKFGFVNAVSDLNNAPMNAAFSTNRDAANAPVADTYFQGFTFAMDSNPDFRRQWAFKDGKIWFRNLHNGSWSAWTDVIPLDNYLPLSGGVMSARGSYPQLSMPMPTSASGDSIFLHIGVSSDGNVKLRRYNATSDSFSELSLSNTELTAILNGVSRTIYHSGNFNPENYLPLTGGKIITGDFQFKDGVAIRDAAGGNVVGLLDIAGDGVCVAVGTSTKKTRIVTPNDTPVYRNDSKGSYRIYDSSNLGNATTSKAGLMSAADKTKLDGLSGQINVVGQASSTYIFPGDPSELDSSSSSTHITLILGTASDFLDAFNNGKVFVSKTVTFNEVQVPSDITYSLLKSIDPDNPTIFQIIMSTVVWGHYIEITIDFENNEYQAISNTINGIIGVNNTGTTN